MKPPIKAPCSDCPWSRDSARGWLGPLSAEEWLALAHSDEHIACHMTNFGQLPAEMRHCAGADIFRSNVCKRPRFMGHERLGSDVESVFRNNREFIAHHERER